MAEKDLRENPFRDEIFNYFLAHGYVQSNRADYDIEHALDTAKLFDFIKSSQPEEWNKFETTYGANAQSRFVSLLCQKIEDRGLLSSLNEKVEDYASNTKISLAYYKSGLSAMTEGQALYEKNVFERLRTSSVIFGAFCFIFKHPFKSFEKNRRKKK